MIKTICKRNSVYLVLVCSLLLTAPNAGATDEKSKASVKSPSSKTLRSMARVYMAYGEYTKAQPLAEKALIQARAEGAADSELAMCLIDLATLYNYQGKLVDAEEMCKSGLELQKRTLYKNHPYLAYTSRTLSSIYYEQGEYSKAKSALDEAIVIMLDIHSTDDKAMAPFYVDMAKVLTAQDNLEQAENYYKKAMPLINTSYGPNHLYTANVLADIAKLRTLQGKYFEAENLINQAIAVQEKTYGPNHHLVSGSWLTKAKICQAKGNFAEAEQLINKSLAALEKSGNPAALAKFQKDAKDIRIRQVAYKSQD
jgi:tetratricopeptide (TPR) repeat protein